MVARCGAADGELAADGVEDFAGFFQENLQQFGINRIGVVVRGGCLNRGGGGFGCSEVEQDFTDCRVVVIVDQL